MMNLQGLEKAPFAYDVPISIAVSPSAVSKSWETVTVTWPQLVTAFSEPKRTGETFAEFNAADKKTRRAKKDSAGAFVGGALLGSQRIAENLTDRDLLTLDFDGPNGAGMEKSLGELLDTFAEKYNNEAVFYSTHSHQATKPRIRLVLPLSRTVNPSEYEPLARMVADDLGIDEVDPASFSPIQCMFFPTTAVDGEYRFNHQPGDLMDPDLILDRYEDPHDKTEWPGKATRERQEAKALDWDGSIIEQTEATQISHSEATEAVKNWTAREWQNLQEYENFLSALMAIAKGVQQGEISQTTGQECAILLAGNRADWYQDNVEKFLKEIENQNIRTDTTFRQKFMWRPGNDPVDDFEFAESSESTKGTAKELNALEQYRANRTCHSAEELEDLNLPPIQFYINDMLPEGVGWLAGAPKVGKSYLAMQLAYAVATGTDFLGYKTNQAPVIYYSLEMVPQLIQERMRRLFPAGMPKDLYFYYDLLPFEQGALQIIREDVKHHQAGVVIIDVYGLVEKQKSNQKQLYNQAYPEIAELRKLAEETSTSLILVTHMNKGSESNQDPFTGLMGSTAMRGATDFNIALVKNPLDKKQVIFHEEGRKNKGIQLVLEMDNKAFFKNLGTTEELDIYQEKLAYKESPIAQCIARLLIDKTKATIKATDLIEMLPAWWSYGKSNKRDTQSLGYGIKKMAFSLKKHDQITFTQERKMDGTYYTFERPKNKLTFVALQMESVDEAFSTP